MNLKQTLYTHILPVPRPKEDPTVAAIAPLWPNCLQTTSASRKSHPSSHMVPQVPLKPTSTLP